MYAKSFKLILERIQTFQYYFAQSHVSHKALVGVVDGISKGRFMSLYQNVKKNTHENNFESFWGGLYITDMKSRKCLRLPNKVKPANIF